MDHNEPRNGQERSAHAQTPECFGDLETVFPRGTDGLRHSPPSCMACGCKTQCLSSAMAAKQGLAVREELVDRAGRSGMMGFVERWSKKKAIHRRRSSGNK